MGWVVASKPVIAQMVLMKQAADLHSPTLNQMAVHQVAETCFDSHVAGLRQAYGARRDAMLSALQDFMPDGVSWTRPKGGMFVWLTLPPQIDTAEVLARALDQENIAFVPGQAFFADGAGCNTLRLSFSVLDEVEIRTGIERLGRLLR